MEIKGQIQEHLSVLGNIIDNIKIENLKFNTLQLPPINQFNTDIRLDQNFIEMFDILNKIRGYCLYWFECETVSDANELANIFLREQQNLSIAERAVPPFGKYNNSKVLYVGVRQGGFRKYDGLSNIAGRIVQHLGYYEKGSTGALHLAHWTKSNEFMIKLNVIELETPDEKDYLYILEKLFAIILKPILGKH